jgi:urate oxidase
LAKEHGVGNPEQFAILVAKHFVKTYSWINQAEVTVEALNWKRVNDNHAHAFVAVPTFTRWAKVQ